MPALLMGLHGLATQDHHTNPPNSFLEGVEPGKRTAASPLNPTMKPGEAAVPFLCQNAQLLIAVRIQLRFACKCETVT